MSHLPPARVEPLVRSTVAPLLRQGHSALRVEYDLATDLPLIEDAEAFCRLLRNLVQEAILQMPRGGDLTITACRSKQGWDLEVADTGSPAETRTQTLRWVANSVGAVLVWRNCPQGGCAVTAEFRSTQNQRRAA